MEPRAPDAAAEAPDCGRPRAADARRYDELAGPSTSTDALGDGAKPEQRARRPTARRRAPVAAYSGPVTGSPPQCCATPSWTGRPGPSASCWASRWVPHPRPALAHLPWHSPACRTRRTTSRCWAPLCSYPSCSSRRWAGRWTTWPQARLPNRHLLQQGAPDPAPSHSGRLAVQADLTPVRRAVICTLFFVSGIVTLVQTFFGDRLPIIQARSAARRSGACTSLLGRGTCALRCPVWRSQPGPPRLPNPPLVTKPSEPPQEPRVLGRRRREGWFSASGSMASGLRPLACKSCSACLGQAGRRAWPDPSLHARAGRQLCLPHASLRDHR